MYFNLKVTALHYCFCYFVVTFMHVGIATSINRHSWVFVLWIVISGLLCFTFVCVVIGLFHSMVMSVCVIVSLGWCCSLDSVTFIPLLQDHPV